MRLDTFIEAFHNLADAPEAVEKIRDLVLELAVRGKLVLQRTADEPAAQLLERVLAEKSQRTRQTERLGEVLGSRHGDEPFEIPANWCWISPTTPAVMVSDQGKKVQTRDICESGRYPVLDQGKMFIRGYCNDPEKVISGRDPIVLFGDHTRETKFIDFDFVVGADGVKLLKPIGIDPRFYFFVLRWLPLKSRGYARHFKLLKAARIPLPPIAEQKRIVAKVDELMALCDRLEAQQQERVTRHAALARASLARFTEAPTPANLSFLFHPSYAISPEDLRKSILTLAIQGKLVPQYPDDEPASGLIARIATEKHRLVEAKLVKPEKPLAPITNDEVYPVPANWSWLRAGELCHPISSGSTPDQSLFSASIGIPYLKVYNIRDQVVDFDYKRQFVAASHHEEKMKRSKLLPGDVIMNIVGPPLGKVAIVPDTYPEWNCNQAIAFFRPIFSEFSPFVYTFLKEGSFLRNIQLIGTAGQDNISVTKCKFIPIPIPPLAEQRRIVAKVDQLMTLVDQLEAQLTASRATAGRLLDAIVSELTAA